MSDENSAGYALANPFGKEDEPRVRGARADRLPARAVRADAGRGLRAAAAPAPRRRGGEHRAPAPEEPHDHLGAHPLLGDGEPTVLYQNWGPNLDGASLVTAIIKVKGRDVALYGHDFTVRAGSMDATNGAKLARLFELAGKRRIPLVGHQRQCRRLHTGRRRRPRRLCRGLRRAAQDQRRGAQHHVHVRLQRRRRLLPAAPGQLPDPAARHLLRPDRSRRGQVGARRGRHAG